MSTLQGLSTLSELRIGVVGAGQITTEHLKVLDALSDVMLCGIFSRTRARSEALARDFHQLVVFDSLETLIHDGRADALLVLVSADQIYSVVKDACCFGVPLFIEKPPGLSPEETKELADLAEEYGVINMVGFNRRYYSVFHKGLEIIKAHGALLGVAIEGHERFWKIVDRKSSLIREKWLYVNSTHTIDLQRFFGGETTEVHSLVNSYIESNGDQLSAAMRFDSGALGNYSAHWYSPGGWAVRLFGEGITVEFKPLEIARWIDTEFKSNDIVPDEVDLIFKPGFFRQMAAFVELANGDSLRWPAQDLREAAKTMDLTSRLQLG